MFRRDIFSLPVTMAIMNLIVQNVNTDVTELLKNTRNSFEKRHKDVKFVTFRQSAQYVE